MRDRWEVERKNKNLPFWKKEIIMEDLITYTLIGMFLVIGFLYIGMRMVITIKEAGI